MTTTTTTTTPDSSTSPRVERAVENALKIGRVWANHGLEMGRSALTASAESLKLAIATLDDVKSKLNGESVEPKATAPKA